MDRRPFVSVNPAHARHVRENNNDTDQSNSSLHAKLYSPVASHGYLKLYFAVSNFVPAYAALHDLSHPPVESETRAYHGRVGSGRRTAGLWGGVGRVGTPAGVSAQETTDTLAVQGFDDNCPERLFGSTNKGNPLCKPTEEQIHSSFLAADQCADAFLSL